MDTKQLLKGKAAVITGAAGAIGREIALLMAVHGASVVVNDLGSSVGGEGRDTGPAHEVVEQIRSRGGEAVASTDSVSDWSGAQQIIATAIEAFGRLDIVMNIAGILRDRIFHNMTVEDWDAVLKVNLYGSFFVSRAAAPHFRKQESGVFVHMTSSSGLIGNIGQANYGAAKAGVVALSKSIALDMAKFKVRSNCISPAAFSRMTETISGQTSAEQAAYVAERKAKTRPEQVAPMAVFLASDAAADINGQIIGVRGNELYLYNQIRPMRSLHRGEGWTVDSLSQQLVKAWKPSFVPLERNRDVFAWEPL